MQIFIFIISSSRPQCLTLSFFLCTLNDLQAIHSLNKKFSLRIAYLIASLKDGK